jgi:hypothetical protein
MILSVSIMAVPERADLVADLVGRLDAYSAGVVMIGTVEDRDTPKAGPWATAKQAWRAHHPKADYHLVIQDDALPCVHALCGCLSALNALNALNTRKPGPAVLSLFVKLWGLAGEDYDRAAAVIKARAAQANTRTEAGWMRLGVLAGGVANCMPVNLIDDFISWADAHVNPRVPHDDHRLSMFCTARRIPIYATIPSLFDHRDGPSIMEHCPGVNRRANWALGADEDAARFCWPAVRPDQLPFHQIKQPEAFASFVAR